MGEELELDSHLPSLAVYPSLHLHLPEVHSALSTQVSVSTTHVPSGATLATQAELLA